MTSDEILDAARVLLPSLGEETVVALGDGLDHEVFLIGADLVARTSRDADADLRREAERLRRLAAICPLPVPAPIAAGPDLLLHRLLPGAPLLVADAECRRRWAPGIATALGAMLRALWTVPVDEAHEAFDEDRTPLAEWREEAVGAIDDLGDRLPADLRRALVARVGTPLPPDSDVHVLSHNDLGMEHVLVDRDGRVTGVVDWSDAAIVDPAKDLGVLLRDLGPEVWPTLRLALHDVVPFTADLRRRADLYATCLALEDVRFAHDTGRTAYLTPALEALARLAA